MKLRFGLWSVALLVLAVSGVHGDTLRLRDGRAIEGSYVGGTPREVRFMGEDGAVGVYPVHEIESIAFPDCSRFGPAAPACSPPFLGRASALAAGPIPSTRGFRGSKLTRGVFAARRHRHHDSDD